MAFIMLHIHAKSPKIDRIIGITGEDRFVTLGRVTEWFRYVDIHIARPSVSVSRDTVLDVVGIKDSALGRKFISALMHKKVAWLKKNNEGRMVVVGWGKHFSKSQRTRELAAQRQAKHRAKVKTQSVTRDSNAPRNASNGTRREEKREEERREEKTNPNSKSQREFKEGVSTTGVSGSDSGRPATRPEAQLKFWDAVKPLWDREDKQRLADETSTRQLFDALWPEGEPATYAADFVARAIGFVPRAKTARLRNARPMSYLTKDINEMLNPATKARTA